MQVTVKTLRHYEQKELLIPNEVDEWTGYRYYSIGQMQKLNSIRHLQQLGFTLEEIRGLYDEESHTPSVEQLTEKIIIMRYYCVGIGLIKMTVGVRRRTHEKVQYCITALEIEKDAKKASI